jgi:hypothetical protein
MRKCVLHGRDSQSKGAKPVLAWSTTRGEQGNILDVYSELMMYKFGSIIESMAICALVDASNKLSADGPDFNESERMTCTEETMRIAESIMMEVEQMSHRLTSFAIPLTGTVQVLKRISPPR